MVLIGAASTEVPARQPTYQYQKIVAFDGGQSDGFGNRIAISQGIAVGGAWADDDNGPDAGSAYVYERQRDGTWDHLTKLVPADPSAGDNFGHWVGIDDDTIVIGAWLDDPKGDESGSVYVFDRSNGIWSQSAKLVPSDGASGDRFGHFDIQGDTLLVSSYYDDDRGQDSGSVYVYERIAGAWQETGKLRAFDGQANDGFGVRITLKGDTAMIASWWDDDRGTDAGAVYVFTRSGGVWSETAKLYGSDTGDFSFFGTHIAIVENVAVIGSYGDDARGNDSGAAYVFKNNGGVWQQEAKLVPSDGLPGDRFGHAVAFDGSMVAIGAAYSDHSGIDSGSAYLFSQRPDGSWFEQRRLQANDAGGADQFGHNVALDGAVVLVSAPLDDAPQTDRGSVYAFNSLTAFAEPDCNENFVSDLRDIASGTSADLDDNLVPDECQVPIPCSGDFNGDLRLDIFDFLAFQTAFGNGC